MHHALRTLFLPLALCTLAGCTHTPAQAASPAQPLTENQKIETLIALVANTKNAQFIRKGTPYDCATAARFMRGKWNWKSSEIKTARDFVRICSAGGSGEGTPYYLRFPDGSQIPSKDFLTTQLDKLEAPSSH